MKYIESFKEGLHTSDIYLCKNKQIALTKSGKEYGNLLLQDKTGTIDGKIWDLHSPGVGRFETLDYVQVEKPRRESMRKRIICRCRKRILIRCIRSF